MSEALLKALQAAHDESLDGNHFGCRQILVTQIVALWAAMEQAEPVASRPSSESWRQAGRFCDANCTALDHHADCVIGNPSF